MHPLHGSCGLTAAAGTPSGSRRRHSGTQGPEWAHGAAPEGLYGSGDSCGGGGPGGTRRAFAAPGHGAAGTSQTPRKAAASAPGDVDGDGFGDLAAGAPEGTLQGYAKAGFVSLVHSTAQGIRVTRHKSITQDTAGIPGVPEADDRFGSSVTGTPTW